MTKSFARVGKVRSGTAPSAAVPTVRRSHVDRPAIPHRYRVGRWGPVVLMDCRECRTPWAPDVEVPRDRLCKRCRTEKALAAPTLMDVEED